MADSAALLAAALNWMVQIQGFAVDFPGPDGGLILFTFILVGAIVPSILGSLLGMAVSRGAHEGNDA